MAVIPSPRPRTIPASRPAKRSHRRTRTTAPASAPVRTASRAPQRKSRRKSGTNFGVVVVGGTICLMLVGLTFLLSSLLGHTMLRRSQSQFEDIQSRTVFAERELTRLNKELRQINTLEGLGSMAQAHQLYRDGRKPVVVAVQPVPEGEDVPQTH